MGLGPHPECVMKLLLTNIQLTLNQACDASNRLSRINVVTPLSKQRDTSKLADLVPFTLDKLLDGYQRSSWHTIAIVWNKYPENNQRRIVTSQLPKCIWNY